MEGDPGVRRGRNVRHLNVQEFSRNGAAKQASSQEGGGHIILFEHEKESIATVDCNPATNGTAQCFLVPPPSDLAWLSLSHCFQALSKTILTFVEPFSSIWKVPGFHPGLIHILPILQDPIKIPPLFKKLTLTLRPTYLYISHFWNPIAFMSGMS